jgi:dihydroxyacetone kinase-like protein
MAGVAAIESASEHGRMSVSYDDVFRWVQRFAAEVEANKEYLTQLDAAIGDADHGINMQRGMSAVIAKVDAEAGEQDVGALLKTVGMASRLAARRSRATRP